MSLNYEAIRARLKAGDIIIYQSDRDFGWRYAEVKKPNPTYITGEHGERVYFRRIAGVGSSRAAARRTVAILESERKLHRQNEDAERRRHKAAIATILAAEGGAA